MNETTSVIFGKGFLTKKYLQTLYVNDYESEPVFDFAIIYDGGRNPNNVVATLTGSVDRGKSHNKNVNKLDDGISLACNRTVHRPFKLRSLLIAIFLSLISIF